MWKRREERERTPIASRSSSRESIITQGWILPKKLRAKGRQLRLSLRNGNDSQIEQRLALVGRQNSPPQYIRRAIVVARDNSPPIRVRGSHDLVETLVDLLNRVRVAVAIFVLVHPIVRRSGTH